jgi:Domain of unknown function (DUF4382)
MNVGGTMHSTRRSTPTVLALAAAAALLQSCTSSKGPSQLEIKLVDAPNPAVDQIVVNVAKVTAHSTSAGWVTVGPVVSPTAVNLLDLQTSALTLGLVNLPAGKITQVRLVVAPDGNYVVPNGSTTHEPLVVPSGIESGIKILGPWDVPTCSRLSVTLDFDGKSSIEYHEANGTWILRPVIRPKKDVTSAIPCEPAPSAPPVCDVEAPCPEGQVCVSGACVPGGTACLAASDCLSLSCADATCSSSASLGAGQACASNADCLSGVCSTGFCQLGQQGALCASNIDCRTLLCSGGSCAPPPM